MFRFEHIQYLWLLTALLPATALFLYFLLWRKRTIAKFGKTALVFQLAPGLSNAKHVIKYVLLALAYVFIVLGFANPQLGSKQEKVKRKGIDVVIALDVSNSMLCEDVKPNRLDRAKNFISNFVDELHNDRLGIVVFAGRAYLQMPLTMDYTASKMYLQSISTTMVPTQGTNIAEAVQLARHSFVQDEKNSKALIIISDGEDNEGGAEEELSKAAEAGIKVFTLGVGSDKGGPIPFGNDYKRDENGDIVNTRMNPDMLRGLAKKGNGKYFQLGSGQEEVGAILKELGHITSKEMEEWEFTDFDNQFQWCLAIAAVLLLLEWWIIERKGIY